MTLDPRGGVALQRTVEASVAQSIAMILATTPGERVMRPDYGTRLHELVFQPNDGTTAGLAIQYVKEALARWEPRIRIEHVDAGPDPLQPASLLISLQYRIRGDQTAREMEFGIDLQGGPNT